VAALAAALADNQRDRTRQGRGRSPLSDAVAFPQNGIVWDFNYRGNLIFLSQALGQKAQKRLRIEDGWVYFIHGWTRVDRGRFFTSKIPTSARRSASFAASQATVRKIIAGVGAYRSLVIGEH